MRLEDFARRRLAGEPVARILEAREFWGLPLLLSPATLVPRPDTETVVELALEMLGAPDPKHPLRIADLGTGSGAILLALLSELPGAYGIGTDISVAALQTAGTNTARLGFGSRAAFVACDYAAGVVGYLRSDGVEPALYPLRRYRRSRHRGQGSRSASGAGWRRRRPRRLPQADSASRGNGWSPAAFSWWKPVTTKAGISRD